MSDSAASRLPHFPVSFFATIMGLAGLTVAWQRAEPVLGMRASDGLLAFTMLAFLVLTAFYAAKAVKHPSAVVNEFRHPVRLHFFPAFSISLLLLSVALAPLAVQLAGRLWMAGAALHLLLTLAIMSIWIRHTRFEITHINPAWFIPVVGNIVVPLGGTVHGYGEISWFFFSIGLTFWLVLFTLVFYRVIFHAPLPERLLPTLFILIAPPAVGFLAYTQLTGTLDAMARVLYYTAVFLTLLLAMQVPRLARMKFALSWWAYSFPLAAMTVATLRMQRMTEMEGFRVAGLGLLAVLSALLVVLTALTVRAILRGEICVEEK